jgi:hypothetical protein
MVWFQISFLLCMIWFGFEAVLKPLAALAGAPSGRPLAALQPVRSAYQPPANSTFLSEQTSHQQSASSTLLSAQINTSHHPPAKTNKLLVREYHITTPYFTKIL